MADIDTIISEARDFADELLNDARDLVSEASNIAAGRAYVNVPDLEWEIGPGSDLVDLAEGNPGLFAGQFIAPDAATIIGDIPDTMAPYIPAAPDFPDMPEELDTSNLFRVDAPNWDLPDFTLAAPTITAPTIPTTPDVILPELPESAQDLFVVPDVTAPTFDDTMDVPSIDVIDHSSAFEDQFEITRVQLAQAADDYAVNWLATYCPNYHEGMAAIESRIATALVGGSAMDEAWEQAIYDRALIRVNDEQQKAQVALTQDYAARGFALPPGALMSGLARLKQELARNLADSAANISVERAKIELQHLQFAMQLSAALRQHFSSAMQGYMQLLFTANGQALEKAQAICNWAHEVFKQRVQLYDLERQRYQAEAQVYAVRLESAFAIIKQFEVQIEAEKLKIDVDRNAIALYEAKISGERQKVEIYNARLQGIRTLLEAEGFKVSVFESQVRAYGARVGGKEAEYNAYRAAIQGDLGRVEAYQATVQAFGEQVRAAGTRVDAERGISQSINEYNKSLIDVRDGNIRHYEAALRGEGLRFSSDVEAYKAAIAAYSTDVDARVKVITSQYERDRLLLSAAVARVESILKAQMTNVESFVRSINSQASITQYGARIIGDMASATLTTNNAIVTLEET